MKKKISSNKIKAIIKTPKRTYSGNVYFIKEKIKKKNKNYKEEKVEIFFIHNTII